uniref:Auxin response factor n=1 Tax=Rhizophora mucronata TaxID=61149 RepID=A0A2P2MPZ4_RHIMU
MELHINNPAEDVRGGGIIRRKRQIRELLQVALREVNHQAPSPWQRYQCASTSMPWLQTHRTRARSTNVNVRSP